MKNTVTQAHVDAQIIEILVETKFDKVTVVTVRLANGFVLVESAGAVDKANYSEAVGICLTRIKNKIWELEGYRLSSDLADERTYRLKNGSIVNGQRAVDLYEDENQRCKALCSELNKVTGKLNAIKSALGITP